jgi:predicted nicotinamide N-methyase
MDQVPSFLATLREYMESLYALRDVPLPALGLTIRAEPFVVALPADPDAPLDHFAAPLANLPPFLSENQPGDAAAEQARDAVAAGTHMPYWGLLWASGQALAETILAERGCGLGLVAAAALLAGASVWAVDCFTEALLFTRFNALRATGQSPQTQLLDWRTPAGKEACRALGPFDIVVAADVLYEEDDLEALLGLVPTLLQSPRNFWLAEPGRRVSQLFVQAASEREWPDDVRDFVRDWPPDGEEARVQVHRFRVPA